ncbi:hypothetical protein AXF42_Ash019975 [Apostasia shenzhenica]|uniref:Uncharacterized protein n=1 Tax=Apostasia shenzhenica TaxID=1088818 RepID=A0A2I0AZN4_9ASPA|nr:hypothetical protein AXF42_Ash019975 [Apostasia shenzhenica]
MKRRRPFSRFTKSLKLFHSPDSLKLQATAADTISCAAATSLQSTATIGGSKWKTR